MKTKDYREMNILKKMWKSKARRSTKLIVPSVTYRNMTGSLNNEHWAFTVPYAFRDALDIKYQQRIIEKHPTPIWTQGPIIAFKEGDWLKSKEGDRSLQVMRADPMSWDSQANKMHQGNLEYVEYAVKNRNNEKVKDEICTQMDFLRTLIYGKTSSN